jgi:hypothetical protein
MKAEGRPPVLLAAEIALVQAIRRVYGCPEGYAGLEAFRVAYLFDFAPPAAPGGRADPLGLFSVLNAGSQLQHTQS